MKLLLALISMWFAASAQMVVTDPLVPPNAAMGGTVIASVSLRPGSAGQITILNGEEPFNGPVQEALSQWQFPPDLNADNVLVVVNFRQPGLFAVGDNRMSVEEPSHGRKSLPYPRIVAEPSYPPNVMGEGSVVFEVKLTPSGSIEKVKTVKGLGALTDAGIEALHDWKFAPARDGTGRPVSATAFVVFVFRTPVLANPSAQPR
jgi:hypothetical protein